MQAMNTYKIIRFYRYSGKRIIRRYLTIEQAREHCSDPRTRDPDGGWWDAYARE